MKKMFEIYVSAIEGNDPRYAKMYSKPLEKKFETLEKAISHLKKIARSHSAILKSSVTWDNDQSFVSVYKFGYRHYEIV